jgi:hypothetical protein
MGIACKNVRPAIFPNINHAPISLQIYFDGILLVMKGFGGWPVALPVSLLSMRSALLFLLFCHNVSSLLLQTGLYYKYKKI